MRHHRNASKAKRPNGSAFATVAFASVAVAGMLLAGAVGTPAAAADSPATVGPGAIFSDNFGSGLSGWKALKGSISSWTVSGDTNPIVSANTLTQSSGNYIRPKADLNLPDMYKLTTNLRIDDSSASGTISVIFDMLQADNFQTQDQTVQFGAFGAGGGASVRIAAPLGTVPVCAGASPMKKGEWYPLTIQRAGGITSVSVDGQLVAAVASTTAGGTFSIGSYQSKFSIGGISINPLTAVPADQPTAAEGCPWAAPTTPPTAGTGSGTVSGDGSWLPAASTTNRAGHEVTSGQGAIDLGGTWQFITDPKSVGVGDGYWKTDADTASWDSMVVPGNWDTHDKYGTYKGIGWYKTTFQTGDLHAAAHEQAVLKFDAVYWNSTVWLNGTQLGSHAGGYTPFQFDVSKYLVDGDNTLIVEADSSISQGAWWSWGGISRPVTLIKTRTVQIDHQRVVATPNLTTGTATVNSEVFVQNSGDTEAQVSVSGKITDAATGAPLATRNPLTAIVTVPAQSTVSVNLASSIDSGTFKKWDLNTPNLYRFDATLDAGSLGGENVNDQFGIRSIVVDGTQLLLNGQKIKLAGANRVSDDPIEGNTEPEALVRRDLDRMKAAGMNMMRIMHYPQAPALLDYADQIGMLIIAETPEWGGGHDLIGDIPTLQAQMTEALNRDFNHPSIFAYSVGNEIDSNTPNGITYDKTMANLAHTIDPSRLVTQVSNRINSISQGTQDGSQFMDFVSVNMYGNFASSADHAHQMYPNVPIFVSEYSPENFTFGTNRQTLDFVTGSGAAAAAFASRDFVAGWSQWTYNDYRSSYGGSGPDLVRGWGDTDVWGRLKKSYDAVQSANAPVSSLKMSNVSGSGDHRVAIAKVIPRGKASTDGPAYLLSGYSLVVRVTDGAGSVVGGSVTPLADISPGDPEFDVPVSWDGGDSAVRAEVTLLSPTGFEVATSTAALAAPAKPTITNLVEASKSVRVRYSDPANSRNYHVEAVADSGAVMASVDTAEEFADLTGLTNGTEYTVTVAAVNSAGSSPADTTKATPGGDLAMAPKIDTIVGVPQGLVLGFSDNTSGATFEVRVADAATGDQVQDYTTANRPGTRAEGLKAAHGYTMSIRRLSGGAAATAWSEPMSTVTLGVKTKPELVVKGLVTGATSAGIVITPQDGVERYTVTLSGPGGDRSIDIEHAAVDLLPIDVLQPASLYQVSVSAISATGTSVAWKGSLKTAAAAATPPETPVRLGFENHGDDVFVTWHAGGGGVPDGYIVTRSACGTTTQSVSIEDELKVGSISASGGSYTVAAFRGGSTSAASEPLVVPGDQNCVFVVTPKDTVRRADGSVPFTESAGWHTSSVLGAGGYPSIYASISDAPQASATWLAPNVGATRFRVEVSLPNSYAADSVRYTLHTSDGDKVVTVDQGALKNSWVDLGEYDFSADTPGNVTVDKGSNGYIRASAARFTSIQNGGVVTAPAPAIANQTVSEGGRIVGAGTTVGDQITVTGKNRAILGTSAVADDYTWSINSPLAVGVWDGVSVTEIDAAGWSGTDTATITVTQTPIQQATNLGSAFPYAVLAGAGVTSPNSTMWGDLGAGAEETITDSSSGGTVHASGSSGDALTDASNAYAALNALAPTGTLSSADLAGQVITAGVYRVAAYAMTTPVTFDAQGDPTAIFVMQSDGGLNTTAGVTVSLVNGANPAHIFWVTTGAATLGADSVFDGTIISHAAVTVGAGSTLNGRAFSVTAAVTLDHNTIGLTLTPTDWANGSQPTRDQPHP